MSIQKHYSSTVSQYSFEKDRYLKSPYWDLSPSATIDLLKDPADKIGSYAIAHFEKRQLDASRPLVLPSSSISVQKFTLFEKYGTKVVPDSYSDSLMLDEIRASDAMHFTQLYLNVLNGKTRIKINGTSQFQKKGLCYIRILLQRPSGRELISFLCKNKTKIPVIISESLRSSFLEAPDRAIRIELNLRDASYVVCKADDESIFFQQSPNFIMFAHECIHASHSLWWVEKIKEGEDIDYYLEHNHDPCSDRRNSHFEEEMTIYGLSGKKILSENTLRREFDLPRRIWHICSAFPSYTQDDFLQLNDANSNGWTRLSNAIRFCAFDEVRVLLNAGADPSSGLNFSAKKGRLTSLQYMNRTGS